MVYNAYTARTKTETWEKRLSCISWTFGCYKTMMQRVDGRQESQLPPKVHAQQNVCESQIERAAMPDSQLHQGVQREQCTCL